MFHTYPDAELPLPPGLAPNGLRSWTWMELAIPVPLFLASIKFISSDEPESGHVRHLWFSNVNQVVDAARQVGTGVELVSLDLLSPGYVNEEGAFKLDQLRQIWRHTKKADSFLFMLADGRTISYSLSGAKLDKEQLELVLSV